MLEAVAAAAVVDELALDGAEVEINGAVEERIEVFERDRRRMQPVRRCSSRSTASVGRTGPS
jgi:hypothetical protein